jgi:hypothetical protein
MRWRAAPEALDLLDRDGGPFESRAYREALVRTVPGMAELSWAGAARDGTTAAIALIGGVPQAMAVPIEGYGAIRASRPLTSSEAVSFLSRARRGASARRLLLRGVAVIGDATDWSFAREIGSASVIPVEAGSPPSARYARLARRSVRRAEAAGCMVRTTRDGTDFVRLYEAASAKWDMRYPTELVLELGRVGVARFDEVLLGDAVVAGLMTLEASDHWMCWLAAQSAEGREVAASYLAYDKLLADAGHVVSCVNLGASAPGSGGVDFKRRLGAEECPIYEWSTAGLIARVNDTRVRIAPWSRRGG